MITATVLKVIDGDSIRVQTTMDIRLDFIDAPETKGEEREVGLITKNWLKEHLHEGDTIQLDIKKQDMYDRFLSVVYKDGTNINGEMLKQKLVEVYSPGNHNNGKQD